MQQPFWRLAAVTPRVVRLHPHRLPTHHLDPTCSSRCPLPQPSNSLCCTVPVGASGVRCPEAPAPAVRSARGPWYLQPPRPTSPRPLGTRQGRSRCPLCPGPCHAQDEDGGGRSSTAHKAQASSKRNPPCKRRHWVSRRTARTMFGCQSRGTVTVKNPFFEVLPQRNECLA